MLLTVLFLFKNYLAITILRPAFFTYHHNTISPVFQRHAEYVKFRGGIIFQLPYRTTECASLHKMFSRRNF